MSVGKAGIISALDEFGPQTIHQLMQFCSNHGVTTSVAELVDLMLFLVPLSVSYDEVTGLFSVPPSDYEPKMYRVVDPLNVATAGIELEEALYEQEIVDNSVFWCATKNQAIHAAKACFYNRLYWPTLEAYESALKEHPPFGESR